MFKALPDNPPLPASVVSTIDNLAEGVAVPIPTLLPLTTKAFVPYVPMLTTSVVVLFTSIIGKPAASLTLKITPVRESDTLNNLPLAPSTLNLSIADAPVVYDVMLRPPALSYCNLGAEDKGEMVDEPAVWLSKIIAPLAGTVRTLAIVLLVFIELLNYRRLNLDFVAL